jgi:hypothetical protein
VNPFAKEWVSDWVEETLFLLLSVLFATALTFSRSASFGL